MDLNSLKDLHFLFMEPPSRPAVTLILLGYSLWREDENFILITVWIIDEIIHWLKRSDKNFYGEKRNIHCVPPTTESWGVRKSEPFDKNWLHFLVT